MTVIIKELVIRTGVVEHKKQAPEDRYNQKLKHEIVKECLQVLKRKNKHTKER